MGRTDGRQSIPRSSGIFMVFPMVAEVIAGEERPPNWILVALGAMDICRLAMMPPMRQISAKAKQLNRT